jgi:25S rRNA (cytosine2870-C5)-methyltransferase
MTKQQA